MLSLRNFFTRPSCSIVNSCIRVFSGHSQGSNDNFISWSDGEKQYPTLYHRDKGGWFKRQRQLSRKEIRKTIPKFSEYANPNSKNYQFPYARSDGGIQYLNFVYYPRFPGEEEDIKINPSPLHFVLQIKSAQGCPYWQKNFLKKLGLSLKIFKKEVKVFTVVKNTPEVNAMLYMVKNLVEIKPLKMPSDLPKDANPLHYFITNDGEMIYQPNVSEEKELVERALLDKQYMDADWIDDKTRRIYDKSLDVKF